MKLVTLVALVLLLCAGCGTRHLRVTIPQRVQQVDVLQAYDLLRTMGLRVSTTQPYELSSLRIPRVVGVSPAPGSDVKVGGTVELILSPGPIGSVAVLKSHPHHRVPNFVGRTARAAVAWAESHSMYWQVDTLVPLHASAAAHLLAAYRVTAQSPSAGTTLTQGRLVGRSFHVTPLALTVVPR